MAKLILSIDQGTTGTTVLIFNENLEVVGKGYSEFTQIFPKPGWVEHDAEEIWRSTEKVLKAAVSSEGGIGTRFSNWDAPWYLGEQIRRDTFTREHHELLALVAPRPFLLLGGNSADGDRSWPFIEAALPVYKLYEGTPRLGLFNHNQGHSVPPEAERRIDEWFDAYC